MGVRSVISISGATLVYLFCIVLIALAVPVGAQQSDGGIPAGTPARGSNPENASDTPTLITITVSGCTVSEGASVTVEDGDGTTASFVDGQRGIEITEANSEVRIEGPTGDFIGNHAVETSDTGFDTDGDYTVAGSMGIACRTAGEPSGEGDEDAGGGEADDQQYGDRKEDVIIKTVPDKPLPKTGGFPLLVGAGLMLLGATVLGSRVIGRS
jgi:hypothetical protein